MWDVDSGKEFFQHREENGGFLAWSPDGRRLVYNLNGNQGPATLEVQEGAKPQRLEDIGTSLLAWSPDGRSIARVFIWGASRVTLYDAVTRKLRRTLSEGASLGAVAFLPAGLGIVVNEGLDQSVWSSVDTGQPLGVLKDSRGPLALSPNGKTVATGGPNHAIVLWEDGGKTRVRLVGHDADITWLAWAPDGKRLASSSSGEKRVLLWDTNKGERLRELGPFPAVAQNVTWSPDGQLVAFRVPDVGWHFWDVERNQLANDPKQWKEDRLAFAPDGRSVLVANSREHYRLRDRASGKEVRQLPQVALGHLAEASWSPDGQLLALPVEAGVELWRGDLGRRLRVLPSTLRNAYTGIGFSTDSKLVAGLTGERLHLWEADTGRLRGILFLGEKNHGFTITPEGHLTGNEEVDRGLVAVVQKEDGTQELLEPAEFEQKYGWKNDPSKVHLLQPLPPRLHPQSGQPMGPHSLVLAPADLPGVDSWTIETFTARGWPSDGRVRTVAYRPDGKRLATGGDDGAIRIWDTDSGELVRILVGPTVFTLSWSWDGRALAAASGQEIQLWEVDTGRRLYRLPGPSDDARFFWPADGKTVLVARGHGLVQQLDLADGRVLREVKIPDAYVVSWAWSSDGKTLAAGAGKIVRLWDMAAGKEIRRLEGSEGEIVCLDWSPDGKRLASVARDEQRVRLWDPATGKACGTLTGGQKGEILHAFAWAPDGKEAIVCHWIPSWVDPATGRALRSVPLEYVTALAWSPDGKQMAFASAAGIQLRNAATTKLLHRLDRASLVDNEWITHLAWSPDRRALAVWNHARVKVLEAATGRMRLPLPDALQAATWSPDGKTLATVMLDHTVRLRDEASGRTVRRLEERIAAAPFALSFSPNGKVLAGGGRQALGAWSVATGKLLWQIKDHPEGVLGLSWSPDGRWLATTDKGDRQAVRIWDGETGKRLYESPLLVHETRAVWSPDGKLLAAGPTKDGEVLVLCTAPGAMRVQGRLAGPFFGLRALSWSGDSKRLTIIDEGEKDTLRVFEVAGGKLVRHALLSEENVRGACEWSPDGKLLACYRGSQIALLEDGFWPRGVILPIEPFEELTVTAEGHYRGTARVERVIRMVVQKPDGTTETLTPREFEEKYGFKNDPEKVRLLDR